MNTHSEIMDWVRSDIKHNLHQCCSELRELDAIGVLPEKGIIRRLVRDLYSIQHDSRLALVTALVNEASRDYVIKFWTGP